MSRAETERIATRAGEKARRESAGALHWVPPETVPDCTFADTSLTSPHDTLAEVLDEYTELERPERCPLRVVGPEQGRAIRTTMTRNPRHTPPLLHLGE